MRITAALATDLALLSATLSDPSEDLTTDLADTVLLLAADARLAVRSFLGLTVTVTIVAHADGAGGTVGDTVPLRFTLLEDQAVPREVATSLLLPLPTAGAGQSQITVVLYAATPGAFVDMAADLSFLTGHGLADVELDQHRGLAGEADITGLLEAESSVGEAIGVLIARGRTREQAYAELDLLADDARTDRATEADRVLAALTRKGPGPDSPSVGTPQSHPR